MIRTQQVLIPSEDIAITFDNAHQEATVTMTAGRAYKVTALMNTGHTIPDPTLYLNITYGTHDTYMPTVCYVRSPSRLAVYVVCPGNNIDKDFSAFVEVGLSKITVKGSVVNVRQLESYSDYVRYAATYKEGDDVVFGESESIYDASLFQRIERDGVQWKPLPSNIYSLGRLVAATRLDIFKTKSPGSTRLQGWKSNDKLLSVYTYDTVIFPTKCFYMCTSMQTFVAHKPIENVPESTFRGDGALTTVIIPGLKYIGSSAFSFCTGLTAIDLPDTLLSIGADAFYRSGIQNVTIRALRPPTLPLPRDIGSDTLQHIYVPASAVDTYKQNQQWSPLASIIQAIPE